MTQQRTCLALALLLVSSTASSAGLREQLKDPEDGWLDGSRFLLDKNLSFLPMPIIISEPAVDGGLGLAGVFFHKRPESEARESDEFERPSMSAVAAAYTGNGSWMVGGGHLGRWRQDTINYTGAGGLASINLKYFGTQDGSGVDFNADGGFILQEMLFRIRNSNWLIGPRWQFTKLDITFDLGLDIPGIEAPELDFQDSGLGVVLEYESLDSTFTPSEGNQFKFDALYYDEAIGGDFDYGKYHTRYLHFLKMGRFVIGARAQGDYIDGDAPFFALPFIQLRGIPALRYQGEAVVTGELEARWDLHPRISAVSFLGAGRAADSFDGLNDASSRVAGGFGIRYLIARMLGMRLGIDVAWGPEDTAVYFTVGHNWRI
jgi:hypothetical protein